MSKRSQRPIKFVSAGPPLSEEEKRRLIIWAFAPREPRRVRELRAQSEQLSARRKELLEELRRLEVEAQKAREELAKLQAGGEEG